MDYEAGEYRKLAIRQFPARELRETAEGKYWKQFRAPLSAQQVGAGTADARGCARGGLPGRKAIYPAPPAHHCP